MCMFTYPNRSSSRALLKGIERFECGGCPECLQKKSRQWALRCGMEARVNVGMMITLTYDTYKNGIDGEENPVDTSLRVQKAHAQRFIKRLRKHFPNNKVSYLLSAEYGKKSGRAHYHALIFGVQFNDLRKYKKSKRGNIIYKSPTLEKIWAGDKEHNGGICTVDCINPSAQVARYCTKYCAKDSGVDDTFMLFSRGIGESELLRLFNGKSYWVEGREYSIPRKIWQIVIENKYALQGYSRYIPRKKVYDEEKRLCSSLDSLEKRYDNFIEQLSKIRAKIRNHEVIKPKRWRKQRRALSWRTRMSDLLCQEKWINKQISLNRKEYERQKKYGLYPLYGSPVAYNRGKRNREIYQNARDKDVVYSMYLQYWKHKNEVAEITRPDDLTRILQLPDSKYRGYKSKAICAKIKQNHTVRVEDYIIKDGKLLLCGYHTEKAPISFVPPRSNCYGFFNIKIKEEKREQSFAPLSRHYRANDTNHFEIIQNALENRELEAEDKRLVTLLPWESTNPF